MGTIMIGVLGHSLEPAASGILWGSLAADVRPARCFRLPTFSSLFLIAIAIIIAPRRVL